MARYLDVAFGVLLGVIGTGPIVAVAAPSMVDPVQLSPQYYKVRLDNARVRVLEFRSRPGDKEAMHSPPPQGIVFALADATYKNTFPNGPSTTRSVAQGDVEWSDAVTHAGENVGSTEGHYYRVELKNCQK